MTWSDLVGYVQQQVRAGYTPEQVRQYLISSGYPAADVNYAVQYVLQQYQHQEQVVSQQIQQPDQQPYSQAGQTPVQQNAVQMQLQQYIRQYLTTGYTEEQIREYLISYGYQAADVDNAFFALYPKKAEVVHTFHLSKTAVTAMLILCFVVVGSIGGYMYLNKSPSSFSPELLDIFVNVYGDKMTAGEMLNFNVQLTNAGNKNRYDVHLYYTLVNINTGSSYSLGDEVVAIETSYSGSPAISIPKTLKSGRYELRAEVAYGTISDSATSKEFYVTNPQPIDIPDDKIDDAPIFDDEKDDAVDKSKLPDDKKDDAVKDESGKDDTKDVEDKVPKFDYDKLNMIEIMNNIQVIAIENIEKAKELCGSIKQSAYMNDCLSKAAQAAGDIQTCNLIASVPAKEQCLSYLSTDSGSGDGCENIDSPGRKDSCYSDLARKTRDYNYCNNIQSEVLKQNCLSLKEYEEKLEELEELKAREVPELNLSGIEQPGINNITENINVTATNS